VQITDALNAAASIVTLWLMVNPVLYPPESCATISPPGSTTVSAWLNDRQGWTAEQGLASLPLIDTNARGTVASPTPASKRQTIALPTKLNSTLLVVIILVFIVLKLLSVSVQWTARFLWSSLLLRSS
jgi:hypothetical protein